MTKAPSGKNVKNLDLVYTTNAFTFDADRNPYGLLTASFTASEQYIGETIVWQFKDQYGADIVSPNIWESGMMVVHHTQNYMYRHLLSLHLPLQLKLLRVDIIITQILIELIKLQLRM